MQKFLDFFKIIFKIKLGTVNNKRSSLLVKKIVRRPQLKILLRHSFKIDQKFAIIKNIYKKTLIYGTFHLSCFGLDPIQKRFLYRLLRSGTIQRFKAFKNLTCTSLKKYMKNMRQIKYITIGSTENRRAGERINKTLIKALKPVKKIDGILFQLTFDSLDKNIVEHFLKTPRNIKSLAIRNQKTYASCFNDALNIIKPSKLPLIKIIDLKRLESLALSLSDYLLKDMCYVVDFFNSEATFEKLNAFSFNISASQREQADHIVRACHKFLKKIAKIFSLKLNFEKYEPLCDLVLDNFTLKLGEYTDLKDFFYSGIAECSQGIPNIFNTALDIQNLEINLRHGNCKLCPILQYRSLENLKKLHTLKITLKDIKINRMYRDITQAISKLKNLNALSWFICDNDILKDVLPIYLGYIEESFEEISWIKTLEISIISENLKDNDYVNLCKSFLHLDHLRDLSLHIRDCKWVSDEIIIEKADLFLQMKALKYLSLDFSFRKTFYNTGLEHVKNYYINSKGKKIEVDDDMSNGKKTIVTKTLGDLFKRKGTFYSYEVEDCAHVVDLS